MSQDIITAQTGMTKRAHHIITQEPMFADDIREISSQNLYIVKNVTLQYGAYESWKLSELSHKELSWINSRKGIPEGHNGSRVLK